MGRRARWAERCGSGPPPRVLGTGHPVPVCTGAPAHGWMRAPRATFGGPEEGLMLAYSGPLPFVLGE